VLPQAMALANIHIGTMAGKLNGVMPGHDAEGLADRVDVDPARRLLAEAALQAGSGCRRRTRRSRGPRPPRPARRPAPCPCSDVSSDAISLRLASDQARGSGTSPPSGATATWRATPGMPLPRRRPGVDLLDEARTATSACWSPWPGSTRVPCGPSAGDDGASIQCEIRFIVTSLARFALRSGTGRAPA
jgi:hypothetical protein